MTSASKPSRGVMAARTSRGARTRSSGRSAAGSQSTSPAADESFHKSASDGNGARASVRVYRQGLGDCILVRVKRTNGDDFKLLIDCGVVLGTERAVDAMTRVVENLVHDTDQKVDVIAITHEHWDHLSGFIQAKDSFKKLTAASVWVAWTEDPNDDLANTLRDELGKAAKNLAACATALHAAGDPATGDMLADIALMPFGAAASSSTSTRAALDNVKGMAKLRICRPTDKPFEIPGAKARIYVLGPPHDPKLIRKINPSTSSPETYALATNGAGALSLGVVQALDSREKAGDPAAPILDDPMAPFHQRVTIPLGQKGRPWLPDSRAINEKDWRKIDDFFREHYAGSDTSQSEDWRRIDGDWLGSAAELALALQSYTNNTSLILALELGEPGEGDMLLFAADAQVGNWESWQTWQCEVDGRTVTGPDLLKRTIFYKVGHHGSHNATLKEHGVDQMEALKFAIIPVDEQEAKKKHWGRMPLPELIAALENKRPPVVVLRTDLEPPNPPAQAAITNDYFELRL
jgi:Metallo-beta-lactamase superfamily